MQRFVNLEKLLVNIDSFPKSFINLQNVCWRRKPRWLPVAKSKQFRVPPRTITPEDERIELMRLNNNYRTQMKAIRKYLHSEYNVKSVIVDTEAHERAFLEDFNNCSKINDAWNEEIRLVREARQAKQLEEMKNEAYKRMDVRNEIKQKMFENIEEIVRREKEASKTFITADNIDKAIEYALENPTDYNFSIDLEGNLYHGRDMKPDLVKKENI